MLWFAPLRARRHFVRRLSYDEIASVMGMSAAQVRNELHRGRQELRTLLAPYFEEAP